MKISPITASIFSIKNNNQKKLELNPKTFDSFDTLSLSFGKKEKYIDDEEFNFKKEYKEIKRLIDARDDFTKQEKKFLKWEVKFDYECIVNRFREKRSNATQSDISIDFIFIHIDIALPKKEDAGKWQDEDRELEAKLRGYTSDVKKLLQNKRANANLIENFDHIDDKYKEIAWLLLEKEDFPVEKIIYFTNVVAQDYKCDSDKLKQIITEDEISEEKLIEAARKRK